MLTLRYNEPVFIRMLREREWAVSDIIKKIPEDGTELPKRVAIVKVYIVVTFETCALTWI